MPCSIGLMNSLGIAADDLVVEELEVLPLGVSGRTRILQWPYWPRPPVWRTKRPSPSASAVMVSL
jgi:hypothetical protein